jgi:flavin reductase (DIM6/NTAB) family NADH-FMN oxidoreductase RutF
MTPTHDLLDELWAPIAALTAAHGDHANAMITTTAVTASLLPETPRILVQLGKTGFTHELALASGAFALHLLPAEPVGRSLELFRMLGFHTGRDREKLGAFGWQRGTTGAPILDDALAYVEGRIVRTLDADDSTVLLADVVAGATIREGPHLTYEIVRERLTPEDWAAWETRREEELREADRLRSGRSAT